MSTTIQQVPTDTYGLDPVHSSFGFGVRYNGLATFRSSFDKVDAQLADGVLTIRGVTKPVTANGSFAIGGDAFGNDRVAFEVQTTVDRREFGLDWQMVKPDGSEALAYDVTISAELQLVKQA